jgi:gliding motility-associated-like protein
MPGLCNPANRPSDWLEGAFDIEGNITTTCAGQKIRVINKSNGSNIRYDFNYTGGGINVFPLTEEMLPIPKTYTILQYGEINGKPMVACKQVIVKPGIDFSYTLCNNDVGIQIPLQDGVSDNTIRYKLGQIEVDVLNSQLPYKSNPITITLPSTLDIYMLDANGNKLCQAPVLNILDEDQNPNKARISKLEMIDPLNVEITLIGETVGSGYDLYQKESSTGYQRNQILSNLMPGKTIIPIPDSTNSYCFFVERPTSCGGWEYTPDVCTLPLTQIDNTVNSNILNWINHTSLIYGISGSQNRSRLVTTSIIKEVDNVFYNSITVPGTDSEFIDSPIDCKQNFCYQIEANITDNFDIKTYQAESISLKRCISRKDIKAPPITEFYSSVNGNAVEIDFNDNSGWALNKPYYFLYHTQGGNYVKADSVNAVNPFNYNLQDPNQESLCFKVGYVDQCGSHSHLSPEVCTVHLSYDDPNLVWTSNSPFSPAAISGYEIEEVQPLAAIVGNTLPSEHSYSPDFGDREDEITYRVKASSAANLNTSFSNLIKVLPIFGMYFPTAFTPNGDVHNESLVLKGKKGMIKDFSLEVFDRDRNKIYSTTDKDFSWNGHINNVPLTPGTYLLLVKAALISGEVITKAEKITILH